jgi:hypothetical protein
MTFNHDPNRILFELMIEDHEVNHDLLRSLSIDYFGEFYYVPINEISVGQPP